MSRKIIGIILIVLVFVFGLPFLGLCAFSIDASYFNANSQSVKLQYIPAFAVLELSLLLLLTAVTVAFESFTVFQRIANDYRIWMVVLIADFLMMTATVLANPYVYRRYGFCTATGESINQNPLLFVSMVALVIFSVFNFRWQRNAQLPSWSKYVYWILVGLFALQHIVVALTEKPCVFLRRIML